MKKTTLTNKILSAVLCLCMVMGTLPMISTTAHATDTSTTSQSMVLGYDGIKSRSITTNSDTGEVTVNYVGDTVVMGAYNAGPTYYPVSWTMINKEGTKSLMFSEYLLGTNNFRREAGSYAGGTLNSIMHAFYTNILGLTDLERGIILDTTLEGITMGQTNPALLDLVGQKFFPLTAYLPVGSGAPVGEFSSYVGLGTDLAKAAQIYNPEEIDPESSWWLRYADASDNAAGMPRPDQLNAANTINTFDGEYNISNATATNGVRPAFYMDLSSILFTSAAVDGKSAYEAATTNPTIQAIDNTQPIPTEWKLTLLDNTRNFNVVGDARVEGSVVTFDYTGAVPGAFEYISIMVTDAANNITHYTKVAQVTTAEGTASFTLPESLMQSDTLTVKVFNEQANGNNRTDLSSAFVNLIVTVTPFSVTNTLTNITSNGATSIALPVSSDYTATLSADTGYILPNSISVSVRGTQLTSGTDYTYTQSTGALSIPKGKINGNIIITAVASTYGISLTPKTKYTFPAVTVGYGEQTAHSVTVTNTGNQATGDLSVALSGANTNAFTLDKTTVSSLAVGATNTFTVKPNVGLAVGTYTATVTVSGGNNISESFDVSFTVNPASAPFDPVDNVKTEITDILTDLENVDPTDTEKLKEIEKEILGAIEDVKKLTDAQIEELKTQNPGIIEDLQDAYRDVNYLLTGKLEILDIMIGVSASGTMPLDEDGNPVPVKLILDEITDTTDLAGEAFVGMTEKADFVLAFDVSLEANGVSIQPDGSITITFSAPDRIGDTLTVAHKLQNGTWEYHTATVGTDGNFSVTVTELSPFIVLANEGLIATSVTLDKTNISLHMGQTATLTATVNPTTAVGEGVWSSSNSAVASVDEDGKVTAKAVGSARITYTIGEVSATAKVTVTSVTSPETGDNSNIALWVMIAFVGAAGIAVLMRKRFAK